MKKNIFKLISSIIICTLSLTGGITAFADVKTNEPMLTEGTRNTNELKYAKFNGYVSSVIKQEASDDTVTITLSDNVSEVITLHTKNHISVFDVENKAFLTLNDIKEGDNLFIIVDANTPMTMNLPPMINDAAYILKTNDMMNVTTGVFDNELYSSDNDLVLNIAPETFITDVMGARKIFTAEDIKGSQCAVVYSFATMSIPAQTTPDAVIILESADVYEQSYNMPLRTTFEPMGYEVKWTANDKPIVISNADITITTAIGSNRVIINGTEHVLSNETILLNGVTYIDSSVLNFIK